MAEIDEKELQQQFASDNYAGVCPEAWQAMEAANRGHVTSYGDDPWTAKAADALRGLACLTGCRKGESNHELYSGAGPGDDEFAGDSV